MGKVLPLGMDPATPSILYLCSAIYVQPPHDGIWDLFFLATPRSGLAAILCCDYCHNTFQSRQPQAERSARALGIELHAAA